MRLLIVLKPIKDYRYDNQYHYKIQSMIYNLIKDSRYNSLHDKSGYKFFCFSNIFPFEPMLKKDKEYFLLISSPNKFFISLIKQKLEKRKEDAGKGIDHIAISFIKFKIQSLKIITYKIPDNPFKLVTSTPVIIRIPKKKIKVESKPNYEYYYWRKQYTLELFINQVEKNIYNKYNEFNNQITNNDINNDESKLFDKDIQTGLFQKFRFKKQISTILKIRDTQHIIIGSMWEFLYEGWENKSLVEFMLDSGLGERNSLGFGFLNINSIG